MYSRCPQCRHQQALTVEQLRQCGGLLVCPACGETYDGLRFLSEHADSKTADVAMAWQFEQSAVRPRTPKLWLAGTVMMLLLLLGQMIFFEGERLGRIPQVRRGLESICAYVHCRLPIYRNLDELAVSNSSLQAGANRSYQFLAALTNQAGSPQSAPDIKLTLLGFNGQPLAERVFVAADYLSGPTMLAADHTTEIRLQLAAPLASVGGYTLTLI